MRSDVRLPHKQWHGRLEPKTCQSTNVLSGDYNVMNENTILFYNTAFIPGVTGYLTPFAYMNPRVFRVAAEYSW
jgi:hypothetical protein